MTTTTKLAVAELNSMPPARLVEDERVQKKFVELYNGVHGKRNGELIYHKERFQFMKMVQENPGLQKCTGLSLYGCFLDVAVSGLSFDGGSNPLIYLIPRNANVGSKDSPKYESRANLMISPYGELFLRMKAGHIRRADNPVVVYEGDTFRVGIDEKGEKWVKYEAAIPRLSQKIIGCFVRLVRSDGTSDFHYLLQDDIVRLKGYSARQNRGNANALYESSNGEIDPGFLKAKTIRHAFKTYPRLSCGKFSALETEQDVVEDEPKAPDYGIEDEGNASFVEAQEVAESVTAEVDESDVEAGF